MCNSVRFYSFHNDSPVLIKINAGQTLRHSFGSDCDEGWHSESNTWEFDGETLVLRWETDGRDCDGRLTQYGECHCPRRAVMAGNEVEGVTFPAWERGEGGQCDEYAELMNY